MSNQYYQTGPERARRVKDLFQGIAQTYDRINDVQSAGLHRLWKRKVVRLASLVPGERALDLCCGTGDISCAMARHGAMVAGVDFSPAMLQLAHQRRATSTFAPAWIAADAMRLPFKDSTFDVVTIGYGLRNLADFGQGLREIHRIAKRGGRLLVLDFGLPTNRVWRAVCQSYLGHVVPFLGRLISGDEQAYAYILESLKHYPTPEGMALLFKQTGWDPPQLVNLMGGATTIHIAIKAG